MVWCYDTVETLDTVVDTAGFYDRTQELEV